MTLKEKLRFYNSAAWKKVREEQLQADHYECQRCKHRGKYKDVIGIVKYKKAVLVHHDFRIEQYPQYKLMRVVNGKRNMYSLCQDCHEIEHEEERGLVKQVDELNEEKW